MKLEKTCLHKFLGHCKECIRDYDESHHPNNPDCMGYYEIHIGTFIVREKEK